MLGTRTALPDCRPLLADPDDLQLVFQPIVDLAGATVAGYEALARFPSMGFSSVPAAPRLNCGEARHPTGGPSRRCDLPPARIRRLDRDVTA